MSARKFRCFAIFGAMRSGSNLLERYINQFDGLLCHGELFNPAFIGWSGKNTYFGVSKPERDANPNRLIDAILTEDTDNLPGFRIFREHNVKAIDMFLDDPECAKIVLSRNPVDSFVSLKIARKTDQWLIENESHRKSARIFFDMREFEEYKKIREAYVEKIVSRLKTTGQKYFDIRYDQLNDISKINQIAKFIGAKIPLETLKQPIKRQNPGALVEKIVNYDEVQQALGLPKATVEPIREPQFKPEKGTDLSRAYFCEKNRLVFAPVPSAPDGAIRKWLTAIDGTAPENDFSGAAFENWRKTHRDPAVFSVIRHPVGRAYDVFMRKIYRVTPGGFYMIREALEDTFGMFLPAEKADLDDIGYDTDAHRTAFKQFLAFVNNNLSGQTTLRTDGRWRSQTDLIKGYEQVLGKTLCIKEHDIDMAVGYFTNRFNLNRDCVKIEIQRPDWDFELGNIYDLEIENLARSAYGNDYKNFRFNNWR